MKIIKNSTFFNFFFISITQPIVTSDLNIVGNKGLRYLLNFRIKFHINKKLIWKTFNMFKADLDAFILNLSYRYNKLTLLFTDSKLNILNNFKYFQTNFKNNSYTYHSSSKEIRNEITSLKQFFVSCPADKATFLSVANISVT